MRLLVLTARSPFARGPAEATAEGLVRALRAAGHGAEAMHLPLAGAAPERMVEEVLIARGLRATNVDRVIALRLAAALVPLDGVGGTRVAWLPHAESDPWAAALRPAPAGAAPHGILRAAVAEALAGCHARFADAAGVEALRDLGLEAGLLPAPGEAQGAEWDRVLTGLLG
ncbi:hypothetical protein [Muricoccus radiodurans]|uniref:hypothetical protein n=1 Tax=Muricoccus radiodurans TaxID=2231721 RepID=UPI003CF56BB4